MESIYPAVIPILLFWSLLAIVMTYGIWRVRCKRYWIGAICILTAIPVPLFIFWSTAIIFYSENLVLKNQGMTDEVYKNLESALAADTLKPETRFIVSRMIASEKFMKRGTIENFTNLKGESVEFYPDSTEIEFRTSKIRMEAHREVNATFGLLFGSVFVISAIAGLLIPKQEHKRKSEDSAI